MSYPEPTYKQTPPPTDVQKQPPPPAHGYSQPPPPAHGYSQPPPPAYNEPPPPAYNQPPHVQQSSASSVVVVGQGPVVHQTTVVQNNQRPPVVVQTTTRPQQQTQAGGFFTSLGTAFDSAATDLSKAANNVANSVFNPLEYLRIGNRVMIESKSCGRSLKVLENGLLECSMDKGTASQFIVVKPNPGSNIIKLRNVAQPSFYLSIQNGYAIGYGNGGPDCDFIPAVVGGSFVTFESALTPGSHIGVLPTGQFSAPAQTNKLTDASHFKLHLIGVQ